MPHDAVVLTEIISVWSVGSARAELSTPKEQLSACLDLDVCWQRPMKLFALARSAKRSCEGYTNGERHTGMRTVALVSSDATSHTERACALHPGDVVRSGCHARNLRVPMLVANGLRDCLLHDIAPGSGSATRSSAGSGILS